MPGQPYNLQIDNLTATDVVLHWLPHVVTGDPPYDSFIINIDSIIGFSYITSSTISYLLDDLLPNVTYNATVKASSSFFPQGGEASNWTSFTTSTSSKCIVMFHAFLTVM